MANIYVNCCYYSSRSKCEQLLNLWASLEVSSTDKGNKLQEASEEQQFLRTVSDFDLWIDEVDKALASEDLGKVRGHMNILLYFLACL